MKSKLLPLTLILAPFALNCSSLKEIFDSARKEAFIEVFRNLVEKEKGDYEEFVKATKDIPFRELMIQRNDLMLRLKALNPNREFEPTTPELDLHKRFDVELFKARAKSVKSDITKLEKIVAQEENKKALKTAQIQSK